MPWTSPRDIRRLIESHVHALYGAHELSRQFWIELTHPIGNLHAERLDTGKLIWVDHVG